MRESGGDREKPVVCATHGMAVVVEEVTAAATSRKSS
jgi:hypothetical protein